MLVYFRPPLELCRPGGDITSIFFRLFFYYTLNLPLGLRPCLVALALDCWLVFLLSVFFFELLFSSSGWYF